jgi:hypothetical protein
MATQNVSVAESVAAQVVDSVLHPKKSKGMRKYDQRTKNGSHPNSLANVGPKPRWMQDIARQEARKFLKECDAIASPSQIYALALKKGLLALCIEIRQSYEYRVFGKPFTATNPDVLPKPPTIVDNRLQVAITNLIPAAKSKKTKAKAKLSLSDGVGTAQVIDAQPVSSEEGQGA